MEKCPHCFVDYDEANESQPCCGICGYPIICECVGLETTSTDSISPFDHIGHIEKFILNIETSDGETIDQREKEPWYEIMSEGKAISDMWDWLEEATYFSRLFIRDEIQEVRDAQITHEIWRTVVLSLTREEYHKRFRMLLSGKDYWASSTIDRLIQNLSELKSPENDFNQAKDLLALRDTVANAAYKKFYSVRTHFSQLKKLEVIVHILRISKSSRKLLEFLEDTILDDPYFFSMVVKDLVDLGLYEQALAPFKYNMKLNFRNSAVNAAAEALEKKGYESVAFELLKEILLPSIPFLKREKKHHVIDAIDGFLHGTLRMKRINIALEFAKTLDESYYFPDLTFPSNHIRCQALAKVAAACIQWDKHSDVTNVLSQISCSWGKSLAYSLIVFEYLEKQDYENAFEYVGQITVDRHKDMTYRRIISKYINMGDIEKAYELSNEMSDSIAKGEVLVEIASGLARRGSISKIEVTLKQALDIADICERGSERGFVCKILSGIPLVWAEAEEFDKAIELAKDDDSMLFDLAKRSSELGRYDIAMKIASSIQLRHMKDYVLSDLAILLTSQERYSHAEQLLRSISNFQERNKTIREMAIALVGIGDFQRGLKMVNSISTYPGRLITLIEIASVLCKPVQGIKEEDTISQFQLILAELNRA